MSDTEEATNPAADEPGLDQLEGVADEAEAQGDDQDQDEQEVGDDQSDDDLEELELEGKKYKVPKRLVQERMLQADYTRKTQEIAETRKALEAQSRQQAESFDALRAEHGKVATIETQLSAYQGINWENEFAADADTARAHYDRYRLLQGQLDEAKQTLSKKEAERLDSQRQESAKALEETKRVLARDIKGWSPELANSLAGIAAEYGVSSDELLANPNPRDWKILHELHTLRQQVKKQTTAQRTQAATAVQPAKTVGAKSNPPTGLDDRLSTAEWVRRRNAQEAAKRRA